MSIVLVGSTSGSVTLQEPAVAGTTVLTLPAVSGTVLTDTSPKAGNVIQVVSYPVNSGTTTSSTSYVATTFTGSITPNFSTSKILIIFSSWVAWPNSSGQPVFTIYRGATNIGNSNGGMSRIWSKVTSIPVFPMAISVLDSPNTTSATTYQVYLYVSTGSSSTIYFNGLDSNIQSSITAFEIGA